LLQVENQKAARMNFQSNDEVPRCFLFVAASDTLFLKAESSRGANR